MKYSFLGHSTKLALIWMIAVLNATLASSSSSFAQPSSVQMAGPILASILPIGRGTESNRVVSAFATIANAGNQTATNCFVALPRPSSSELFSYQTTNSSNQLTGNPNTLFSIPAGGIQSLAFFYTWTNSSGISPDIELVFDCSNTEPAPVVKGLNTFLVDVVPAGSRFADMVAISATDDNDGYLDIMGETGVGFAFASVINIKDEIEIEVIATKAARGTAGPNYPADLSVCLLEAGVCRTGYRSSILFSPKTLQTYSFGIRAIGRGMVAERPDLNRVFLYFRKRNNARSPVGATSVAIRTAM